jgi:hypothetical protein
VHQQLDASADREPSDAAAVTPRRGPSAALRRHLRRRTPWGAPWWLYVAAIGAANVARQLLLPADTSTAARIATFGVMVIAVGALVTAAHRLVTARTPRRGRPPDRRAPTDDERS